MLTTVLTRPNPRSRRRARTRLASAALAAAALLAPLVTASPALAHDELVGFGVVEDAAGAATGISLQFSNEIIQVGTEIIATGPTGADVLAGAPVVRGRDVEQPLATPLPEGETRIVWRVVSSDGHPIAGALALTMAADGTTALEAVRPDAVAGPDGADDAGGASDSDGTGEPGEGPASAMIIGVAIGGAAIAALAATALILGRRRRTRTSGGGGNDPAADPTSHSHDN